MNRIVLCLMVMFSLLLATATTDVLAKQDAPAVGRLIANGKPIELKVGYAHLHDNEEGLLDGAKELRILLADREVEERTLQGLGFLEVEKMATEGKLRGILIKMSPEDSDNFAIVYLYPPRPEKHLVRKKMSLEGEKKAFTVKITDKRVIGTLTDHDNPEALDADEDVFDISVKFDVPLFKEPAVTEVITGQQLRTSPMVAVLQKKAAAMIKGDIDTLRKISTTGGNRALEAFLSKRGEDAASILKQYGEDVVSSLETITRIVVRGDSAVVLFEDTRWVNLLKENGTWKSDD